MVKIRQGQLERSSILLRQHKMMFWFDAHQGFAFWIVFQKAKP